MEDLILQTQVNGTSMSTVFEQQKLCCEKRTKFKARKREAHFSTSR